MVLVAVVGSVVGTSPCLYLVVLAAALTACVHGHTSWLLGAGGHSGMCFMLWCTFFYFSV